MDTLILYPLNSKQKYFIQKVLSNGLISRFYALPDIKVFSEKLSNNDEYFFPCLNESHDFEFCFVTKKYWRKDARHQLNKILTDNEYNQYQRNLLISVGMLYKNQKYFFL